MKKPTSALLALLLLFLSSCSSTTLAGEEKGLDTATDGGIVKIEVTQERVKVSEPLTWARLGAIPKVTPDMTTDEMRQMILAFADLSMNFVWTPSSDFYSESQDNSYSKNALYGGIPYDGFSGNPYKWMLYYDESTGVLDSAQVPGGAQTLFSDCSSYAYSAWSRVSNSMSWSVTAQITLPSGIVKVGEYEFDPKLSHFKDDGVYTTEICEKNGEQVMYRSYERLLPADGTVNFLPEGGHVLLIKEVHTVKNGSDIDGNESYAVFYDQRDVTLQKTQADGSVYSAQAGRNRKYTFRELFEKGYLPFGIPELYGLDPVEQAEAALSVTGNKVTAKELCEATLQSNYPILTVHVTVRDGDGSELYRAETHIAEHVMPYKEYALSQRLQRAVLEKYAGKGSLVTVQTRVSTGEMLIAYEGELIK